VNKELSLQTETLIRFTEDDRFPVRFGRFSLLNNNLGNKEDGLVLRHSPTSLFVDYPAAGVHPSLLCNLEAQSKFGLLQNRRFL
jgi:hypothetical protein